MEKVPLFVLLILQLNLSISTGRVIVLKCKMGSQDPENSFQVLNDMLSVNEGISDDEKPLDFVMQGVSHLI